MDKCLVTKLNGSVHDDTLPLLGYQQLALSISNKGKYEGSIELNSSSVKPIKLVGDGYFIDANGNSLGKETTRDIKGIYINTSGSFLINIPNNFREGAAALVTLGNSVEMVIEETSVEQLLKILGSSYTYSLFFIRTKILSGDVTKLINLWGSGSIELNITEISNDAYGNLDDVVFTRESNGLWGYYFSIYNIPRLTGNIETILNKFAQYADYGDSPAAHDMFFTIVGCPLIKYKGNSIGDNFIKTFTIQTNNTWTEK